MSSTAKKKQTTAEAAVRAQIDRAATTPAAISQDVGHSIDIGHSIDVSLEIRCVAQWISRDSGKELDEP